MVALRCWMYLSTATVCSGVLLVVFLVVGVMCLDVSANVFWGTIDRFSSEKGKPERKKNKNHTKVHVSCIMGRSTFLYLFLFLVCLCCAFFLL